jgi:hypothetical protein
MPTADEIDFMSDAEFRRYEARLKYAVARTGYKLVKQYRGENVYMVIDPDTRFPMGWGVCGVAQDMNLADVADWVNS